ncbi:MAG: hypothetical protein M3Q78_08485 [Acidobacteriota bacterium]|nr:hypothetical protein [Acidobacteriota bacterium]
MSLRRVAQHQATQDHEYRERKGLEQAVIPEKVMVCMASRGSAKKLLRTAARIVGRHAYKDWFTVYIETSDEESGKIEPHTSAVLRENIVFAKTLGAKVVKLKSDNIADALLKFARENAHYARHLRTIGAFALADFLVWLDYQPLFEGSKRRGGSRHPD